VYILYPVLIFIFIEAFLLNLCVYRTIGTPSQWILLLFVKCLWMIWTLEWCVQLVLEE